jgi:hypothetical protein
MDDKDIGPCHISGIPLQKGSFPFCKGEKPRCLAGEWLTLSLEEKKIPSHMTRARAIEWKIKNLKKFVKNYAIWLFLNSHIFATRAGQSKDCVGHHPVK